MPRNVEIKASIKSLTSLLKLAKTLSKEEGKVLMQSDSFYNTENGRLKLRTIESEGCKRSQLIFYQRPDQAGPKLSDFHVSPVAEPDSMDLCLASSLGRAGVVAKTRHLFLIGQTRVHVDQVKGLGDFMELEVVLNDDQSEQEGADIAKDLMKQLEIAEEDLITGAYVDLLAQRCKLADGRLRLDTNSILLC